MSDTNAEFPVVADRHKSAAPFLQSIPERQVTSLRASKRRCVRVRRMRRSHAGVVHRRPEGSLVYYEVMDKAVFKLISQAQKLIMTARRQQLDELSSII